MDSTLIYYQKEGHPRSNLDYSSVSEPSNDTEISRLDVEVLEASRIRDEAHHPLSSSSFATAAAASNQPTTHPKFQMTSIASTRNNYYQGELLYLLHIIDQIVPVDYG